MKIESKYDIGDVVFAASYEYQTVREVCPDCLGAKEWAVTTPAGTQAVIECPTCQYGYDSLGHIEKEVIAPKVDRLTVGLIKYDHCYDTGDMHFVYMCRETGVGSGTIWGEEKLFGDRKYAEVAAAARAKEQQAHVDKQNADQLSAKMKSVRRKKLCEYCLGTGSSK